MGEANPMTQARALWFFHVMKEVMKEIACNFMIHMAFLGEKSS
jgi:hypothetical protein